MYAADRGYEDTIKLLLDRGASAETKDNVSTRRCIIIIYACWYKVINELDEDCKKDIADMRWDDCWQMMYGYYVISTFNIACLFGDFLWNEMTFFTCVFIRIIWFSWL